MPGTRQCLSTSRSSHPHRRTFASTHGRVQTQLDAVLLPSCPGVCSSLHHCLRVAVVISHSAQKRLRGRWGPPPSWCRLTWGCLGLHMSFLAFPAVRWSWETLSCTVATNRGSCRTLWALEPSPGRAEVVRAEPGARRAAEPASEAVGGVCTGALRTSGNGTFILLNWNIVLQCYICE